MPVVLNILPLILKHSGVESLLLLAEIGKLYSPILPILLPPFLQLFNYIELIPLGLKVVLEMWLGQPSISSIFERCVVNSLSKSNQISKFQIELAVIKVLYEACSKKPDMATVFLPYVTSLLNSADVVSALAIETLNSLIQSGVLDFFISFALLKY